MTDPTGNPYIDGLAGQSLVDLGYSKDFNYFLSNQHLPWEIWSSIAVLEATSAWAAVADITFSQVYDSPTAQFVEYVTTLDHLRSIAPNPEALAMHNYPQTGGVFGYFAVIPSWTAGGLARGGHSFENVIHELGHGLGLDHPYEPEPFPGVDGPTDLGDFQLNQNLYTVMSYIHPSEPDRNDPQYNNYGHVATPMALDIAAIQHLYGPNVHTRKGNDVYVLPGVNQPGTFWSCIWDVSGVDEMRYDGAGDAFLDLRAATLDGTYTTGGLISAVNGVRGGFTIANTVVIENATGGSGNDMLTGNAAVNILTGNGGSDTLDGGLGHDTLDGGPGDDIYVLRDVEYRLNQGPMFSFYDTVYDSFSEAAGGGYDTVRVMRAADGTYERIDFTLPANVEAGAIVGDAAFDLSGNALANKLTGNGAKNTLNGKDEADILNGGGEYDTLNGGTGNDTYVLADVTRVFLPGIGFRHIYDVVTEDADAGTDTVEVTPAAGPITTSFYALTDHVENGAVVGYGNLDLYGNELGNRLTGNGQSNGINGGGGGDTLDGGPGADTLNGELGDDWFYVDNIGDQIIEAKGGGGADRVFASANYVLTADAEIETFSTTNDFGLTATDLTGNDFPNTMIGNYGKNTLDGSGGPDRLIGLGGGDFYVVDNIGDRVTEAPGEGLDQTFTTLNTYTLEPNVEALTTTPAEFSSLTGKTFTGNGISNSIYGASGHDVLDGAGGADGMVGKFGDDRYYVDNASDVVIEATAEGVDTVITTVTYVLPANVEGLVAGGTSNIALVGNVANDSLYGNSGNNALDGAGGADGMAGGLGNDVYYVDNAGDVIVEYTGEGNDYVYNRGVNYTLASGQEIEILDCDHAGTTALVLIGNEFGNLVYGNAGANALAGGYGNDTMTGGGGADAFYFNTAPETSTNVDIVADFSHAQGDILAPDDGFFTALSPGPLASAAFHIGNAAHDADDRIIYKNTTGELFYDSDGTGAAAAVRFAALGNLPALTNADFFVV